MSSEDDARRRALDDYDAQLARELLVTTQLSSWDLLHRQARAVPDAVAIAWADQQLTFGELHQRALACSAVLESWGVGKGDRVSFAIHMCPEWAVLHYALGRLGAVAVPVSLVFESREIHDVLERGGAGVLIAIDSFDGVDFAARFAAAGVDLTAGTSDLEQLRVIRGLHVRPEGAIARDAHYDEVFGTGVDTAQVSTRGAARGTDPAYIVFTSGSTSRPKPALVHHGAFLGAATGVARALGLGAQDKCMAFYPTFHTGGISFSLMAPHVAGAAAHVVGAFDPHRARDEIRGAGVTALMAFDTMLTKILKLPDFDASDVASVRKLIPAGTPEFVQGLKSTFDLDLLTFAYGSTECGAMSAISPAVEDRWETRRDSNGRPMPGSEMCILEPGTNRRLGANEPGEICFRGWSRFIEYVDMPEENASSFDEDGYFRSGDYGFIDEDGYLYFRGRYKLMIKTGGENVSEREVELFLEDEFAEIEMAQVVGVPDEVWGEAVVAFVQVSDAEVDVSSLRERSKGKIANFKIPRHFLRMDADSWPLLPAGRTDRPALRELAIERLGVTADASALTTRVEA